MAGVYLPAQSDHITVLAIIYLAKVSYSAGLQLDFRSEHLFFDLFLSGLGAGEVISL